MAGAIQKYDSLIIIHYFILFCSHSHAWLGLHQAALTQLILPISQWMHKLSTKFIIHKPKIAKNSVQVRVEWSILHQAPKSSWTYNLYPLRLQPKHLMDHSISMSLAKLHFFSLSFLSSPPKKHSKPSSKDIPINPILGGSPKPLSWGGG